MDRETSVECIWNWTFDHLNASTVHCGQTTTVQTCEQTCLMQCHQSYWHIEFELWGLLKFFISEQNFEVTTDILWNYNRSVGKRTSFCKGRYTLVTLPRTVTPYCDSVDGPHDHVMYQKLVTQ
jgi:hypothetical protein